VRDIKPDGEDSPGGRRGEEVDRAIEMRFCGTTIRFYVVSKRHEQEEKEGGRGGKEVKAHNPFFPDQFCERLLSLPRTHGEEDVERVDREDHRRRNLVQFRRKESEEGCFVLLVLFSSVLVRGEEERGDM
jgi:hypothetical protein